MLTEERTTDPFGGMPRGTLADAERLIAGARFDLYENQALDRAERTLLVALDDLRRLPPGEALWRDVKSVRSHLAALALRRNDRNAATAHLEATFRVEPDHVLDHNLFPPSLRAFADRVRAQVKALPAYDLSISTQPRGVETFVDGRPVGRAPVTIRLPAGEYRVEARFSDVRGIPRTLRLDAPTSIELHADFEGAIQTARGLCVALERREDVLAALVRMAGVLGVREIVAMRLEDREDGGTFYVASLVDAGSGQDLREGRVKLFAGAAPPSALERLADFLTTGEVEPPVEPIKGARSAPAAVARAPHPVQHQQSPNRIPSYVAAGAGVASLATALVFVGRGAERQSEMNRICPGATCQPGAIAEYERLQRARNGEHTAAWIFGVTAGVGLATAAVLYLVPPGSGAEATALEASPSGLRVTFELP